MSPALSVLTFVVSVDNFVTGLGVYAALDTGQLPAVGYCASHCIESEPPFTSHFTRDRRRRSSTSHLNIA